MMQIFMVDILPNVPAFNYFFSVGLTLGIVFFPIVAMISLFKFKG